MGAGSPALFAYGAITLCGGSFQISSAKSRIGNFLSRSAGTCAAPQPPPSRKASAGLGCSRFARHYSGNRDFFLFLGLLRWFSSPGSPPDPDLVGIWMTRHYPRQVSPFGNPRIIACSQLPEAFRSVLRPSSALATKASTVCPCLHTAGTRPGKSIVKVRVTDCRRQTADSSRPSQRDLAERCGLHSRTEVTTAPSGTVNMLLQRPPGWARLIPP